jgi:ribonuclease J
MVEITCYGGVDEIGGNKFLLEFSHGSIFLDFGQSYKAESLFFEEFLQPRSNCKYYDLTRLGILPKLNGIYRKDVFCPQGLEACAPPGLDFWESGLKCYEDSVQEDAWIPDAVFISHAHMDHCGYVPYLGNIPLVCSEETQKLMKAVPDVASLGGFDGELTEIEYRTIKTRSASALFPDSPYITKEDPQARIFETVANNGKVTVADGIDITGFGVGHSIPGSMACLVEADNKQILYTGDLRFHGRLQPTLDALDNLKPDAMICEGTRIDETIPDDEARVETELSSLISRTDGLFMVGFTWKDIERYETVRDAAMSEGRTPVFDPRLAYLLARLGRDIYAEGARAFLERSNSMIYSPDDYTRQKHKIGTIPVDDWDSKSDSRVTDTTHKDKGVSAIELRANPENYVVQLDFFRFKNILDIEPPPNSVYVRAQCEPFNPRMELSETRMINWLKHFDMNERNNHEPFQIHASGHASGKEIQDLIERVKPKKLIPIHTERPKLFYNNYGDVTLPGKSTPIQF